MPRKASNNRSYLHKVVPNLSTPGAASLEASFQAAKERAKDKQKQRGTRKKGEQGTYVGVITFMVYIRDAKRARSEPILRPINIPWNDDHAPSKEEVQLVIDSWLEIEDSPVEVWQAKEYEPVAGSIFDYNDPEAPKLEERRAKDGLMLPYSGFDNSYDTKAGKCAFDYVRSKFGKVDGCVKVCANDEFIGLGFLGVLGPYPAMKHRTKAGFRQLALQHKEGIDRLLQDGVTPLELRNLADTFGVGFACLDEDNMVLVMRDAWGSSRVSLEWNGTGTVTNDRQDTLKKRKSCKKSMVVAIRNLHLHAVECESLIRSAAQAAHLVHHVSNPHTGGKAAGARSGDSKVEVKVVLVPQMEENPYAMEGRLIFESAKRRAFPASATLDENRELVAFRFYDDANRASATDFVRRTEGDLSAAAGVIYARYKKTDPPPRLTLGKVQHELQQEYLPLPKASRPNHLLEEWLSTLGAKDDVHSGWFDQVHKRKYEYLGFGALKDAYRRDGITCHDICSAYPKVMYDPLSEWMLFDHNATPQPFDDTPMEHLKLGMYYVETEDRLVLNGSRIYIREELQQAAQYGVPFKIVSMVLATGTMPKDVFHRYIHAVLALTHTYDLSEYAACEMERARKRLLVMPYGMLGKGTTVNIGKAHVTQTLWDPCGYARKKVKGSGQQLVYREIINHDHHENGLGEKLYVYALLTRDLMLQHNIPCYLQVQGFHNVRMVEMLRKLGGVPLAVKTDCWVLQGCTDPEAQPDDVVDVDTAKVAELHEDPRVQVQICHHLRRFGTYKVEPMCCPHSLLRTSDMQDVPGGVSPWADHPEITDSADVDGVLAVAQAHGGVLVTAKPGRGKTWLAREISRRYPHAVMVAPTHKASNNLNGCTIHALVGASPQEIHKRSGDLRKDLAKLPQGTPIIVDEAFMVGEYLWFCLYLVYKMRPLVWIILGDHRQLGAVEQGVGDIDYMEHPTLKLLAGHQRIKLHRSYRCDEALEAISDAVYDDPSFNPKRHFPVTMKKPRGKVNIAWTNAAVHLLNRACMQGQLQRMKNAELEKVVQLEADPLDDDTQDVWLYPGLPVISCTTTAATEQPDLPADAGITQRLRAAKDMQNNEVLDVVEVDEETLTVRSRNEGNKLRTFPTADFHRLFRVSYCITVHKTQGDTITEDFTIWEHERMSRRMLYTALTRAKHAQQISLGELPEGFKAYDYRVHKNLDTKLRSHLHTDKRDKLLPACDMTVADYLHKIEESGKQCTHCGEEVKLKNFSTKNPTKWAKQVTLDRKDNSKGHTRDNVVIACLACNRSHHWELSGPTPPKDMCEG